MFLNPPVISVCVLQLLSISSAYVLPENGEKYFNLRANREVKQNTSLSKRDVSKTFENDLDFLKLGFYIEVGIGSNNDTVKVLLDTGSSDFWVPGSDMCNSGDVDSDSSKTTNDDNNDDDDSEDDETTKVSYNCSKFGSFDYDQSTSFQSNNSLFLLTYGDGSMAYGTFGQDTITLGNITIDEVNIAVANFTNATNGVIGIGYEATEATYFGEETADGDKPYKYTNFPKKLVQDGIINKAAYSLFLDEEDNANILFGAVDQSKYTGKLYEFPIVAMNSSDPNEEITRIAITLNSISLNNGNLEAIVGEGYIPAVLDSGTTSAALPVPIAETIAVLLGLEYSDEIGKFYGACDITKEVYFKYNFQGVEFISPVSSYFADIVDEDDNSEGCLYQIFITEEPFIILGDSFLRDFYTVIDLDDNVACLAYKANSTSSKIKVISSTIPGAKKPPISETFGTDHKTFEYNGETLVTTAFKHTKATLTLDTAYETITITPEADDDTSDYYDSDYYTDDYTDDYTTKNTYLNTYTKASTDGFTDIIVKKRAEPTSGSSLQPYSSTLSNFQNGADSMTTGAGFTFAVALLFLLF